MPVKQWKIQTVKLSDVKPSKDNQRAISQDAMSGLRASIDKFGLVDFIVWNERSGNIVSGHQRYAALIDMGVEETPMIVVDMSERDEKDASLTMNNPEIEGTFDDPIMELLGQVQNSAPDLFSSLKFGDLKASLIVDFEDVSGSSDRVEYDTECPCCGNKWNITVSDVLVVRKP